MAWLDSGMPDSAVGYGDDAPKLTPEQLAEFAPASYARAKQASGRKQAKSRE